MKNIVSADSLLGLVLNGRYKVVEVVHSGSASIICKGVHELMDRTVAIKVLAPNRATDVLSIKRFQQGAQAASHLSHPGVVTVYDYGFIPQGLPFLVMDYLDGTTMTKIVEKDGPLSLDRFHKMFYKLAKAMAHAHQLGVIHRDLKPSHFVVTRYNADKDGSKQPVNLVLSDGDELPVIVDFNIATLMPSPGYEDQELDQVGEVIGTPHFMSPEQSMGAKADERSDIYILGCSMYYALTGSPVFKGTSIIETMSMHMGSPPNVDALPAEVRNIVLKTLEKDPADRIQTMDELAELLLPTAVNQPAEPKTKDGKRKRFWPF